MKIRTVFGCLFFLLGVLFSTLQILDVVRAVHLEGSRVVLQFVCAAACLALGSLAVESAHRPTTFSVSVVAFLACFLSLLAAGFLAWAGAGDALFLECLLLLIYAGLYGILGFVFSLLSSERVGAAVMETA